jgi:mannose-6-phosphate isomerase-like protein (cupin superfamily)
MPAAVRPGTLTKEGSMDAKPVHPLRRRMLPAVLVAAALGGGLAVADEVLVVRMGSVTGYRLLDLEWDNGPFPGSKIAVLAGDPAAGPHHNYLKLPDGAIIAPHWHSTDEFVTVVQGTILVGHGATIDEKSMRLFGPGGFIHVPAKTPHYARAKGQVVLSQTRTGAADTHWIEPAASPAGETTQPAHK